MVKLIAMFTNNHNHNITDTIFLSAIICSGSR